MKNLAKISHVNTYGFKKFNFCAAQIILSVIFLIISNCSSFAAASVDDSGLAAVRSNNLKLFPIERYDQKISTWLNPKAQDYQQNLLSDSYQNARLLELKHSYYGTNDADNSPWSSGYINFLLKEKTSLPGAESALVDSFARDNGSSDNKSAGLNANVNYGINFRPYDKTYFDNIRRNMQINQFANIAYTPTMRAIATGNLLLRSLPTDDQFFHNHEIAGEGYPFDNLEQTAIYVGTPLYILGVSQDKRWDLVLAPDYIGWVHGTGVARVDNPFIRFWQDMAYEKLVGLIKSNFSVINSHEQVAFTGYVGMLFPVSRENAETTEIFIPFKKENGQAEISTATLNSNLVATLPWKATKANFANVITNLQGRPYGWGNIGFYNDCSSEMKAIYTLMGIFLPRNTKEQMLAGKVIDLSDLDTEKRLNYLMQHGVPLLTLVYIKGHIFLYVGNYSDKNGNKFALSYQQMWGLRPHDQSYRSVVGKSVFFPLLASYPEDPKLVSHAGWSTFELIYLNQWPSARIKQTVTELLH